jgi:raffinose/stachyose/melibiose transport system substrate-binding protein
MRETPALRRGFASAKRFIALAAASALVVGAGATMAHAVPSQAKPKVPAGEIEFWHWRGEDKAVFDQLIARFQNQNPGVKITQVITPSTPYQANAFQQLRNNPKGAAFAAFRGPQFWQMANGGLMKDVSKEAFVKNVNTNSLNAGKLTGKQYGVPYHYLFNMPVYNTEIFQTVGVKPPTTFPQFLDMCKKLKAAGYIPMAWIGSGARGQSAQISNAILANEATDSEITGLSKGQTKVSDPWFQTVAGKYEEMRNAGCFPDNPLGTTEAAANALFAQGRAAILPTGSFSMGAVKALNPAMEGKMQLMMIPSKANVKDAKYEGIHNNTFILGINNTSSPTQQAIARAWIDFLTKPINAEYYANGTSQHAVVNGVRYTNPDLKNTSEWLTKNTKLAPRFLILNLGVSDEVQDLLIGIVGGKSASAAIAEFAPRIAAKAWS